MSRVLGYATLLADMAKMLSTYAIKFVAVMAVGVTAFAAATNPMALLHGSGWWLLLKYVLIGSMVSAPIFVYLAVKYSLLFARKIAAQGVSLAEYGRASAAQRAIYRTAPDSAADLNRPT